MLPSSQESLNSHLFHTNHKSLIYYKLLLTTSIIESRPCNKQIIGEMLGRSVTGLFGDEISTSLDSFNNFQTLDTRQCVNNIQGTALISLLQPAPETYNLFTDV
ncbi:hypothetical protein CISIN_1g046139mg [Citrus sinensis]|uniref:Uncharacterized protein n=1 Tax=Citrus sinensis TaxID=2711 RepID=A0A067F3K6_CITSI|nr:hypothetical protein CISIN_1g046139mg [Citrus sinensis]